jgi:hypothetical protein
VRNEQGFGRTAILFFGLQLGDEVQRQHILFGRLEPGHGAEPQRQSGLDVQVIAGAAAFSGGSCEAMRFGFINPAPEHFCPLLASSLIAFSRD